MFFDDVDGFGTGYDATPAATSIFSDGPMVDFGESFGVFFAIELTDRLGRIFEGRVIYIDYDLGNNSSDLAVGAFFCKSIMDGLRKPVTDLALTHGYGGFEWHGGRFVGGSLLFMNEDITDLGTIAVRNNDFVFVG